MADGNQNRYRVRVQYDVRDTGYTFGDFERRDEAEHCLIALAGRLDVRSAAIEVVST